MVKKKGKKKKHFAKVVKELVWKRKVKCDGSYETTDYLANWNFQLNR